MQNSRKEYNMAKDDYFVIACRILSYLYDCLKKGNDVDIEQISFEKLNIKQSYYEYIIKHMVQDGYLEGVKFISTIGRKTPACDIDDIMITPKGIEFLEDNSKMKKAVEFLKTLKETVPGI